VARKTVLINGRVSSHILKAHSILKLAVEMTLQTVFRRTLAL
jgi:hypothetical protein